MKTTFLVGLIVLAAMLGANADDMNCHTECKDGVCNMVCARGKREMAPMDENVRQKRGNINCSQKCEGSVCNTICAEVGRRKRDIPTPSNNSGENGTFTDAIVLENVDRVVLIEKNDATLERKKRNIDCRAECVNSYCSVTCIEKS